MRAEQDPRNLLLNGRSKFSESEPQDDGLTDPSTRQKGLDFGPLLRTVRRNILLIAGTTTVVTLAVAYVTLREPRVYQGTFRILVEPITSQGRSADPSAISRQSTDSTVSNIDYPTLLQVLQSPELLAKIAAQIQSRYPEVTADSLTRAIKTENLVIQRIGTNLLDSTRLVEVSLKEKDPEKIEFILKEFAKGYLRYSLEDRRTRIGGGIEFIEDQLPSLQQRVNTLEGQLQTLKQQYRLTDPENEGKNLSEQLQEVRSQRLQTQRELAEQQTLYTGLQRQLGMAPNEAIAAAALSENPRYQELVAELKKVEAQLAVKSARFSDDSPVVKTLREQRDNLAGLVGDEARRNLGQRFDTGISPRVLAYQNSTRLALIKQLADTANTTQLLQIRTQAVSQTEAFLDQKLQQFPAIVRQYNDLQQQLEIATKTLNQFLTQRETLRIEAAQKEVPWELVAEPAVAKDATNKPVPAKDDTVTRMMMGLVGGLFLGLVAAFLKDKAGNVFYSSEDVPGALQLPVLSVIPFKRSLDKLPSASVVEDSFSKAFNSLYTNIRFLSSTPARSLVVSSAGFGDGKTTIALNLALAAAAMGQRVLLVDANLRLPQIHTLLNLSNSRGLTDLLAGDALELGEVIQQSPQDKYLSVLTSGELSLNSAKLLGSTQMQKLIEQFQDAFDLVVYDTPNLAEFSDANFISAQADGLILAVGVGKTKCPAIKQVLAELKRFRLPILGVVSNHPKKGFSASQSYGQSGQAYRDQPALLESLNMLKPVSTSAKRSGETFR